jgi:hypothetical protein
MSQETGTSHIWIPVDRVQLASGVMPTNESAGAVDIYKEFPTSSAAALQEIWDNRIEGETEGSDTLVTRYTIFNKGAGGGVILDYLGYGPSARDSGGAREAVALADENPDKEVVAVDELQGVPKGIKVAGFLKNIKPYADAHMANVHDLEKRYGMVPTILAGRSKGGRVSTIIAAHPDMPQVEHVITADVPGNHLYLSKLGFGLRVGVLENLPKYKDPTLVGIDEAEEAKLSGLDIPVAEPTPMSENLKKSVRDMWLIRSLGAKGLTAEFDEAMAAQPNAQFTNFHATGNLGMPLEDNNRMLLELMDKYGSRLDAYIGYTRHFAEGHGPRFGRQVALALSSNKS